MKVTCPHRRATLKPKFAENHIPGCKLRTAAQSKAAKEDGDART